MRAKSKDIDKHDGWMGTGVVIKITKDATYVVTNNHICTWDADHICYVEDSETKTEYPISLVKSNHFGRDIQIVKFDGVIPGKQAVKGVANASIQDSVYMVGHNNGNLFIYGEGIVAGWDDEKNLEVQISSTHGNSGSGIINKDGYLVGLIFAGQILHDFPYTIGDSSKAICVNSEVVRLMVAGIIE